MKSFNKFSKKLIKSKSGQGATEYILLLVVVVAVVLMFKNKIIAAVGDKMGELNTGMSQITTKE